MATLLDEIFELATDNKQPLTVLLRKCLVLAHQLKNNRLQAGRTKNSMAMIHRMDFLNIASLGRPFGRSSNQKSESSRTSDRPISWLTATDFPSGEHLRL